MFFYLRSLVSKIGFFGAVSLKSGRLLIQEAPTFNAKTFHQFLCFLLQCEAEKTLREILRKSPSFGFKILSFIAAFGKASPSIAYGAISAFEELGCIVDVINLKEERRISHLREVIIKTKPDFVFTIDAIGLESLLFQELKIPYVSWFVDDPFLFLRPTDLSEKYYHLFIWDRIHLQRLKERGIKNLHYLPLSTDLKIFREITLTPEIIKEYGCNLSLVGNFTPERGEMVKRTASFDIHVYGEKNKGWESLRYKGLTYCGEIDYRNELPKLYNVSKINLNLTALQLKTAVNQRVFDVPACGSFLLTDFRDDLITLFREDEEVVYFKNLDDLREKVDFYLEKSEERQRIAKNAQRRILEEHTYLHRMRNVIQVMKESL